MKEKITPSEQNLKADFDQYEAPLDLAAFDQFKAALDEQDKSNNIRRFIIIGLSALIPVVLFLGITYGDFSVPSQEIGSNMRENSEESNTATLVNTESQSTINQTQDLGEVSQTNTPLKRLQTIATESSELQHSTTNTSGSNSSGLSDLVSNQLTNTQSSHQINRQKKSDKYTSNDTPLTQQVNGGPTSKQLHKTRSNHQGSVAESENGSNTALLTRTNSEANRNSNSTSNIGTNTRGLVSQTLVNSLDLIPSLETGLLGSQLEALDFTLGKSMDRYQTHFYFGVELGYNHGRDFGSQDQFLQAYNRLGSQVKAILGYQLSPYSAIEIGYQQRKVSSSWEYQSSLVSSESFVNTHLISTNIHNSFPIFKNRLFFTNTLGYTLGFGDLKSSDLNTTGDYTISPAIINTSFKYKEDFIGVESNLYHMLSAAAGFNYRLNYNFDLGINANYNFGFKSIRYSDVDYIYGEGLEGNYQGQTRGNFTSVNLKLLYRMR